MTGQDLFHHFVEDKLCDKVKREVFFSMLGRALTRAPFTRVKKGKRNNPFSFIRKITPHNIEEKIEAKPEIEDKDDVMEMKTETVGLNEDNDYGNRNDPDGGPKPKKISTDTASGNANLLNDVYMKSQNRDMETNVPDVMFELPDEKDQQEPDIQERLEIDCTLIDDSTEPINSNVQNYVSESNDSDDDSFEFTDDFEGDESDVEIVKEEPQIENPNRNNKSRCDYDSNTLFVKY